MSDPHLQEYLAILNELENSPSKSVMSRLFKMVEDEYPPAIHTFSVCLERGIGVEKNAEHSFEYCKAAAERGNGAALNNMGCHYLEGRFVPKDPELALRYFSSAVRNGHVGAMHNSAYVVDQGIGVAADGDAALKCYTWAFENGYTESANNLGVYYISGAHVTPDPFAAQQWFQKGASAGNELAVANLEKLRELQRGRPTLGVSEWRKYAKIWLSDSIY